MAIQAANDEQKKTLENILKGIPESDTQRLEMLRTIFEQTDVFNQAELLVEKSRERAEALAESVQPASLQQFLYFLIDTVLAPEEDLPPEIAQESNLVSLSLTSNG